VRVTKEGAGKMVKLFWLALLVCILAVPHGTSRTSEFLVIPNPMPASPFAWTSCRGGLSSMLIAPLRGGSGVNPSMDEQMLDLDASYWLGIGPRMLKNIKDMMRATEKLLDHSVASLRALHHSLEERGAQLRALEDKAAALRELAEGSTEEIQASDDMLDMTLDVQQQIMVYLGTVMTLIRRANFLEETVAQTERLIQGGALQEIQEHLAALTHRHKTKSSMAVQEANFARNFDRMAIDWLLYSGLHVKARQLAELSHTPLPRTMPKLEAAGSAISAMLKSGDLGPLMRWRVKNKKAVSKSKGGKMDEQVLSLLALPVPKYKY
jgi:hypothetical protein